MSDRIEDADFDDLGPTDRSSGLERYQTRGLVRPTDSATSFGGESLVSHLQPRPRLLQSMTAALEEKRREIAAKRAVIRELKDGLYDQAELEDAKEALLRAPERARIRLDNQIKLEKAQAKLLEDEAALRQLELDFRMERTRQRQDDYRAGQDSREKRQTDNAEVDALKSDLTKQRLHEQIAQVKHRTDSIGQPPPVQAPPASASASTGEPAYRPPIEIQELVKRVQTIQEIQETCDLERMYWGRKHELNQIDAATLEIKLAEQDRNEAWAISAFETRQEQGR